MYAELSGSAAPQSCTITHGIAHAPLDDGKGLVKEELVRSFKVSILTSLLCLFKVVVNERADDGGSNVAGRAQRSDRHLLVAAIPWSDGWSEEELKERECGEMDFNSKGA